VGRGGRQLAVEIARTEPSDGSAPTDREADLIDWGVTCGLAFALALAEDVEEGRAETSQRALIAARSSYRQWGDSIAPRPC